MNRYRSMMETPIGWLGLVADDQALLKVISRPDQGRVLELLNGYCPDHNQARSTILRLACAELAEYFSGGGRTFSVPLKLDEVRGFTRSCLDVLRQTSYGEILSYGEVAVAAGSPRGARAVGNAMAANPWPIIVPCHRVIASGGKLGGYSGGAGPATKNWLLEFEQQNLAQSADLS